MAAWDVTVRANATSTADIPGRVFSYYLAIFTGGNGRPVNSSYYTVSKDGLRYSVSLGIDGNGFIVYGNSTGFLDAGSTPEQPRPLYHDVLAANKGTPAQLTDLVGGVSLSRPEYPIFFEPPADETLRALGIPLTPTLQTPSSASFAGTAGGNTSNFGTGGTFNFTVDAPGVYTMVISQDGVNFDPALPANRQVRIVATNPGPQSVTWDGLTNAGVPFPVGGPYPVKIDGHAGEYHFPMLDVENNLVGGPVDHAAQSARWRLPAVERRLPGRVLRRPWVHQRQRHGRRHARPGSLRRPRPGREPAVQRPRARVRHGDRSARLRRPVRRQRQRAVRIRRLLRRHEGSRPLDLLPGRPDDDGSSTSSPTRRPSSTSASSPPGIKVGQTVTVTDTAQLTGFNSLAATAEVEFSLVGPVADPSACPTAPVVAPVSGPVDRATGRARRDLSRSRRRRPATTTGSPASWVIPGTFPRGRPAAATRRSSSRWRRQRRPCRRRSP